MNSLFDRWLPVGTRVSAVRDGVLGIAGLAFVGAAIAAPATLAQALSAEGRADAVVQPSERGGHGEDHRVLGVQYQAQPNFYYCGPAATRIALSASGRTPSQEELAERLGTTQAGTPSALDITRVLNEHIGEDVYRTTEIRGSAARPEQVDRLHSDVVRAVDADRAVVANIKGTAADVDGGLHFYEGGHYVTVMGYRDEGRLARIADPADPQRGEYWMTVPALADWIAERGYSS